MIKNIIFDLGNVLISFQPEQFLKDRLFHEARIKTVIQAVFRHKIWSQLDKGMLTEAQATEIFCQDAPEAEQDIRYVMSIWKEMLLPIPETIQMLKELKAAGYRIFALSNYPKEAFEKTYSENDFFKLLDGKVISYTLGLAKPQKEIYEHLLAQYSLQADETLFIDDLKENTEGAKRLNIHTLLLQSPKQLKEYIKEHLIRE